MSRGGGSTASERPAGAGERAKQSQFAGVRTNCKSFVGALLWRMRLDTGSVKQSQFPHVQRSASSVGEDAVAPAGGAEELCRSDERKLRKGSELLTCGEFPVADIAGR